MRLPVLILSLIALAGCGTPGAPQPPSLNIPKPVSDLKAVRKGDTVTLSWTAPENTTDGALVHHSGKMVVRREAGDGQSTLGEVPLKPGNNSQQSQDETLKDSVAGLLQSGQADFAVYTVETENKFGKSGG